MRQILTLAANLLLATWAWANPPVSAPMHTSAFPGGPVSWAAGFDADLEKAAATLFQPNMSAPGGWTDLEGSLNGICYAIVEDNDGNIIVGGSFTEAGGVPALNVAKWDGNSWSAIGSGLDGTVRALAILPNGTICAGGDFSRKNKKWNGTNWIPLGGSLNGTCYAFAVDEEGRLYAGGSFTGRLDTVSVPAQGNSPAHTVFISRILNGLARLDTLSGWEPLLATNGIPGAGVGLASFADNSTVVVPGFGRCFALATHGDKVYIGGSFTHFSGILASRVVVWERNPANSAVGEVSTLGTGLVYEHPFNTFHSFTNCQSLAVDPSDGALYAGGRFNRAGGVEANFIAKWNGSDWSSLGSGFHEDGNSTALEECRTLLVQGGDLYAGGKFSHAGGVPAKNFAKWDGEAWVAFCGGFVASDPASFAVEGPKAMATDSDGSIFVGGLFDFASSTETQGIAKWDLSGDSFVWYADADADSYGDPNDCATSTNNQTIAGRVANNDDCNDDDLGIHPGAAESCNGLDEDCDGEIDENTGGILETCNNLDDNCNGEVDEGFDEDGDFIPDCVDCAPGNPDYELSVLKLYLPDADGDGYGCAYGDLKGSVLNCSPAYACAAPDETYVLYVGGETDCDDSDPDINPAAAPIPCNGIDENCLGDIPFWYSDYDGDGFGSFYEYLGADDYYYYYGHTFEGCVPPSGDDPGIFPGATFPPHTYDPVPRWSRLNTDCDDTNPEIFPGSIEICNVADDDCDTEIDENLAPADWFADADNDGFGDPEDSFSQTCPGPPGYILKSGDCDDSDQNVNPAAAETCDEVDNNCDGRTDEGFDQDEDGIADCQDCAPNDPTQPTEYFPDDDGDGFGLLDVTGATLVLGCQPPVGIWSTITGDCDDTNPDINPDALDTPCDGVDENCDLIEDKEWYADMDQDGHGYFDIDFATLTESGFYYLGCDPPTEIGGVPIPAWSTLNDDCDDADALEFPGQIWHLDVDEDGHGTGSNQVSCQRPVGAYFAATELASVLDDCDDSNANRFPGNPETPDNATDDDCDGNETCFADADNDGYRSDIVSTVLSSDMDCTDDYEALTTDPSGDCNDGNQNIYPGATEICNLDDDDCDGEADEGAAISYFADTDNDGFGNENITQSACSAPVGYVADNTDCDDTDPDIYPGAAEICNGMDDDCDGQSDNDLTPPTAVCQNLTVVLNDMGAANIDPSEVNNGSSDNCSPSGSLSFSANPNTFNCDDSGIVSVTLSVADELGNTATCTAAVTVLDVLYYAEAPGLRAASDGSANDRFGWGLDLDGPVAIAGAPDDKVGTRNKQGSAYVFLQNQGGADNWGQLKQIKAADGAAVDYFGNAISIDGTTALVGAHGDNIGTIADAGSAYIFEQNFPTTDDWGQRTNIAASNGGIAEPVAYDYFGNAVSLKNGRAVIGAAKKKIGANNAQGAAYIYGQNVGGPNAWGNVKKLTASDGAASNFFGQSVAQSGDLVLVGANGHQSNRGAAYFFDGSDAWAQTQKIMASDALVGDGFGTSVSLSGDYALIGTPNKATYSGAAYVFKNNAGTWSQLKKLVASDAAAQDRFGTSVELSGDYAYVGALKGNAGNGAVYVFHRDAGGPDNWGEIGRYTASDGAAGDNFGYELAASGDVLIVSANSDDVSGKTDQGSVYVFTGEDCGDAPRQEGADFISLYPTNTESHMTLFPNPTTDGLSIMFSDIKNTSGHLAVLDVFGRKCIEQFFAANDFAGRSLHLSFADRLPNGMYFLQVRLYDGQTISGKFEVAR